MIKKSLLSQLELAWSLLDYHLSDISVKEMSFEVTQPSVSTQGFPETEGYDIGMPTIAWILWHMDFWWSMALNHNFGDGHLKVDDISWPNDVNSAYAHLTNLKNQWSTCLLEMSEADFAQPKSKQWPLQDKPFYEIAGWLNMELMKNAAEIGSIRFAYGAQKEQRVGSMERD